MQSHLRTTGQSECEEFVLQHLAVRVPRAHHHRWEARLIDGVWEALGLQAHAPMTRVRRSPFSGKRAIQEIARVQLHAWGSGEQPHAPTRLGMLQRCRQLGSVNVEA